MRLAIGNICLVLFLSFAVTSAPARTRTIRKGIILSSMDRRALAKAASRISRQVATKSKRGRRGRQGTSQRTRALHMLAKQANTLHTKALSARQTETVIQAMLALLKQANDIKRDKLLASLIASDRKIKQAISAIQSKKDEIAKKREQAKESFLNSVVTSTQQVTDEDEIGRP